MARVIVALFDSRADAERAGEMLLDAGIERRDIEIRSNAATATSRTEESSSWWDWLFGESEDRTSYNEGLQRGGAVLSVTTSDERADRVRDMLEALGADVDQIAGKQPRSGATPRAADVPTGRRAAGEEEVIPVAEERVRVGKRPVARGGVRVYTRVTEHPVEEDVRLREERVRVERRPVDRPVTAADEAFRDRTIEMTQSAEEAVVARDTRIVEEVTVGKDVGERVEKVRETVRRTDVDVQQIGAHDEDFRRHWGTLGRTGSYDDSRLAYAYGTQLGGDPRYTGRDWTAIEADARQDWEHRSPGTWERFKDSIRYAWDRARSGSRRAA